MIGKLSGIVDSCFSDHIIINVNGVGYLLHCMSKTLGSLKIGEFYSFFVENYTRNEHIYLYGFSELEEKKLFTALIMVKGVGPKLALSILSQIALIDIKLAIKRDDKRVFNNISGLGVKLVQRIIVELKDKITINYNHCNKVNNNESVNIAQDAIFALINLGLNKSKAQSLVNSILEKDNNISINDLIKVALINKANNL